MRHRNLHIIAGAVLWLCAAVPAASAAEPPAQIAQLFACQLNEGQTGDNAWALLEALRDNVAPNRGPEFGMFAWVPYRGPTDYDFVFGVISKDLPTMARDSMDYYASPAAAAIGQRFQTFADCDSAIVTSDQITEGSIGMTAGDRQADAVVETFACSLNSGKSMKDWDAAVSFWKTQVEKIDSPALNDYLAYVWTPFRGTTGTADLMWVGNAKDLMSWAQGASDYANSKEGQAADARFAEAATCTNQLWTGYWLVAPRDF